MVGCAPSNLADAIRAGGENNATVCGKVTTIYGTVIYMRSNPDIGGNVTCFDAAIKTEYPPPAPTQAVIPMAITPTFTVTPVQPLPATGVGPLTVPRSAAPPPPPPAGPRH